MLFRWSNIWPAGAKLNASDSGALLPQGYRDKARINPENMFVATIYSAQTLCWLHIAFGMGVEVESNYDKTYGALTELALGSLA